jgi:hypothetical protein
MVVGVVPVHRGEFHKLCQTVILYIYIYNIYIYIYNIYIIYTLYCQHTTEWTSMILT